jgi:hypothetical protein
MAEERSVAFAILGIVAVISVVGLVMLFSNITAHGIYGGQMRQGESELRPVGEEPLRYTSPVPDSEGGTFYSHRPAWVGLERDACPDDRYPVVTTPAHAGARRDCVPSELYSPYLCCPATGQAGFIATGVYE